MDQGEDLEALSRWGSRGGGGVRTLRLIQSYVPNTDRDHDLLKQDLEEMEKETQGVIQSILLPNS